MQHNALRHASFFEHMEEFGYFSELEAALPEDFTSVFEIARVLEDEDSALFKRLSSALTVASKTPKEEKKSRDWKPNRHVPVAEEFDVEFIRSVNDVRRILPSQHVLPEEVFVRKLARRELMMRVSRTPVILPFGNSSSEYNPNYYKQKVYLLLDTSASMLSHHRFQMAKAAAYVFLKRNLKELGHIYFRTFDREIGPLVTATDMTGLRALIRHVMRLRQLGNGTAMEKAIMTACGDICGQSDLSGAEILIITDGAAHLDRGRITEALGPNITVNTIKIGDAKVAIDEKILQDEATRGSSPESHALAQIEERIHHLEVEMRNASTSRTDRIQGEINSLRGQASRMRIHIVEHMRGSYGREIEGLSRVFVNVDDIAADSLFRLSKEQIDELHALVIEAEEAFREGIDAETLKEIALLYEHVAMLLKEGDTENNAALQTMQSRLSSLLDDFMQSVGRSMGGAAAGIGRDDLRDLSLMLQTRSLGDNSLLAALLSMLRRLLTIRPFVRKLKVLRRGKQL